MPVEACFGNPRDLIRTGSVIDAYQCHQMSIMLVDQTVLRRAVAVRRQMVANRCRTCCDVSRWGSAGDATAYELRRPPEHMHQRDDPFVIGAFREAREYAGFQQESCIDRARRAWRLRIRNGWHGRRRGNIGRSGCLRCFGCFDRDGCFGRFVRSIRPPLRRQACRVPVHCPQ